VPVRPALPATVIITQARHPLEGRDLRVLGWMRRLGRLELMLELPDGSKRLIPAEHTSQHDDPDPGPGTGTLGRTADLLALSVLVSALCTRSRDDREQAARNPPAKEDDRAACAAQSDAGPGAGATPGPDRPAPGPAGASGYDAAGPAHRQGGGRGRRGIGGRR
jgi:hypothetical protein